jgi:hypothetical protein
LTSTTFVLDIEIVSDYVNRKYCTRDAYGTCNGDCSCLEDSWICGSTDDADYCLHCNHCGGFYELVPNHLTKDEYDFLMKRHKKEYGT